MRKIRALSMALIFFVFGISGASGATIGLFDWALNIDGSKIFPGDTLPGSVDASGFDFTTGLGSIDIDFNPGTAGSFFVGAFFDHEIDEPQFSNEFGSTTGSPAAGQSWEIDEPGYVFGNIFNNFVAGTLDNTNAVPFGLEDDVSMAMDWQFALAAGEVAIINFLLSETAPTNGFYLAHTDPDSDASIYFSSSSTLSAQPIPEPSTMLLVGAGLVGLVRFGRKFRKK